MCVCFYPFCVRYCCWYASWRKIIIKKSSIDSLENELYQLVHIDWIVKTYYRQEITQSFWVPISKIYFNIIVDCLCLNRFVQSRLHMIWIQRTFIEYQTTEFYHFIQTTQNWPSNVNHDFEAQKTTFNRVKIYRKKS